MYYIAKWGDVLNQAKFGQRWTTSSPSQPSAPNWLPLPNNDILALYQAAATGYRNYYR